MKVHELGTPKEQKLAPLTKPKKRIEITKTQLVSSSIIMGKKLR
jgi:hypothetical protein